jgi:hypothetical protein
MFYEGLNQDNVASLMQVLEDKLQIFADCLIYFKHFIVAR